MKPFYVKAEGINHDKQQELLDLAVDAGAVLDEYRSSTRYQKDKGQEMTADWSYFGVTDGLSTLSEDDSDNFGDNAVGMTYDQAWEYVTGIIRANKAPKPVSREETIKWLRENTTVEDWASGNLIIGGWTVERLPCQRFHRLTCGDEFIHITNVFPPATPEPATPARNPLFDRIKQALGSREVEIAGEDHLVGQVKGDAHKARILDKVIKEFKIYPGQEVVKTLKARLEVAKESPEPATPKEPLFDRIKKTLGSDITDEDSLVDHIDDITTVANAAEYFVKSTHYALGDAFDFDEMNKRFDLLVAVTGVKPGPELPTPEPRVASPEDIEKAFRNAYSGVNATPITESVGSPKLDRSKPRNKYDREIIPGVHVDVYDVLNAFETGGADIDHGVKKLLAPGGRGIKDEITDLEEAINSIQRRIDHIKEWSGQ